MSEYFQNEEYNQIFKEKLNNKLINNDNICAICKDTLLIDTIDLWCNHRYHSSCLMESFIRYQPKKCPLCSQKIILNDFKTTCSAIMANKKICGKVCYNNEAQCKLHTKVHLRKLI